jgi:hypothetical protein
MPVYFFVPVQNKNRAHALRSAPVKSPKNADSPFCAAVRKKGYLLGVRRNHAQENGCGPASCIFSIANQKWQIMRIL